MKRREFVKNVATVSAVASAAGVLPRSAFSNSHVSGANERVRVGLIGCGGRGSFVAQAMMKKEGDNFSLRKFHDALLAEGSIAPALMWQVMGLKKH